MNCIYSYSHNDRILYVGRTIDLKRRHKEHKRLTDYSTYFDILAQQLGWNNIELRILEENIDYHLLNTRERYYFNLLRPTSYERRPKLTEEDMLLDKQKKLWEKQDFECLKAIKS